MNQRSPRIPALLTATVLLLASCGGNGDNGTTSTGGDGLSGSIVVSGSSTVLPISSRVGQAFRTANPGVGVSVNGPGTGDGFAQFCAGQIDIADASRPIKASEAESCAANGIEYLELQIAVDGISVLTNVNSPFECLAVEDLYALLGPESFGFDSWADANELAAEVGGKYAPYPDAPLEITAPGEESGTYDTFVEFVIEGVAGGPDFGAERAAQWAALSPPVEGAATRPDYISSADDNVIIEGIIASDTSLGWVGYAYYTENANKVKALGIDAGGGCTTPTAGAIAGGTYPMARPLFIYVNVARAAEKPELTAFVDYYLSDAGLAEVTNAGYVALDDYADVRASWAGR